MSDVPGDRPSDIASGPTVADPTTCADALGILRRYAHRYARAVRDLLESGRGESVKPGDPRLARAETRMIATPQMALEAAAVLARSAGYAPTFSAMPSRARRATWERFSPASRAHIADRDAALQRPVCALLGR